VGADIRSCFRVSDLVVQFGCEVRGCFSWGERVQTRSWGLMHNIYLVAICLSIDHLGVLELEQIFELLAGMHTLLLGLFVNSAKMLFYGLRGKQGTRFGDLMSAWHLVASPFEHAHLRLLSIPKWHSPPPFEYLPSTREYQVLSRIVIGCTPLRWPVLVGVILGPTVII
jgi:hypothetical protein